MVEAFSQAVRIGDGAAVSPWMISVLSNAIIASLIASLAWIGSRLFQKPALWHAIWVVALIKLFLAPVWSIPVTLSSERLPVTAAALGQHAGSVAAKSDINRDPASPPILVSQAPASAIQGDYRPLEAIEVDHRSWPDTSSIFIIFILWVLGGLYVLLTSTYQILRFNTLVRRSDPADAETNALVHELVSSFRDLPMRARTRMADRIIPPLLWPIGRTPTIVLPSMWWQLTTQAERKTVLIHELVHWRRGDHWVRLLQWIASIVFWWHPLVWIARGELHRLEEQCCDAEVMHRLPDAGRSYASALLSASQWLDDNHVSNSPRCQTSLLAMPMSRLSQFESFHRRIEMLESLYHRPFTRYQWFAVFLSTLLPLASGLSLNAQQPAATENQVNSQNNERKSSQLVGRIKDLDGEPIADARVRVVIPSADLRFPVDPSNHIELWCKTDAVGRYTIDINGVENETTASVDMLHPGRRRLVGTLMSAGDPNQVKLSPSELVEFDAKLPEALYFAGRVVDEAGAPIEGVFVSSSLCTTRSCAGIERSLTDAEGRFAVYSYESKFLDDDPEFGKTTAAISFQHDHYVDAELPKLEDLDRSQRDGLRVVMKAGYSIAGTVNDPNGTPATGVVISISQTDPYQRKAVRTDEKGHFRFDGISGGNTTLRVVDVQGNRKSIEPMSIEASNLAMTVTLKPIESPINKTHQVLGMTLADVTTATNEAYDLRTNDSTGVMIVNPGDRFEDFAIGELRPGYVFWMVGMTRVHDLRETVDHLVQQATVPTTAPGLGVNPSAWIEENGDAKVRVVYSFDNEQGHGTATQYMRLTAHDIAELKQLSERLGTTEVE